MHQVKDPELSLQQSRFSLWPGNFYMPQAQPKKKKKCSVRCPSQRILTQRAWVRPKTYIVEKLPMTPLFTL